MRTGQNRMFPYSLALCSSLLSSGTVKMLSWLSEVHCSVWTGYPAAGVLQPTRHICVIEERVSQERILTPRASGYSGRP